MSTDASRGSLALSNDENRTVRRTRASQERARKFPVPKGKQNPRVNSIRGECLTSNGP